MQTSTKDYQLTAGNDESARDHEDLYTLIWNTVDENSKEIFENFIESDLDREAKVEVPALNWVVDSKPGCDQDGEMPTDVPKSDDDSDPNSFNQNLGSRALPSTLTNVTGSQVLTPSKHPKKKWIKKEDYHFLDTTFYNLKASKRDILERLKDPDLFHRLIVFRTLTTKEKGNFF